jgi:hypothetical protein
MHHSLHSTDFQAATANIDPLDKDHGADATFGAIQGECSLIFTCSRY